MANNADTVDRFDVDWKEDVIEMRVIEEGESRSIAIAPGVDAFGMVRVDARNIEVRDTAAVALDISASEFANAEYDRLIRKIDEFGDSPVYHNRLAILARTAQRFEDAKWHAKSAATLVNSSVFSYRYAITLLDCDNEGEAHAIFERLANAGDIASALRLAEKRLSNNDIAGARKCVALALDQDSLDWRSNMIAGATALHEGVFESAIRHFRVALNDRPRSLTLHLYTALAHHYLGNDFAALKSARRAAALSPFDRKGVLLLADLAVKEGRQSGKVLARRMIRTFLRVMSDDHVIGRFAHLARESKTHAEAARVLEALPAGDGSDSVKLNLGVLHADLGKTDSAERLFRQVLLSSRSTDVGLIAAANLANLYLDQQKYDKARKLTARLIERVGLAKAAVDPYMARLVSAQAKALYYQERIADGEAFLAALAEVEERQPRVDFEVKTVKLCYETIVAGDFESALDDAEIALGAARHLKRNHENSLNMALNNYVYVLIECKRLPEAAKFAPYLRADLDKGFFITATIGLLAIRQGHLGLGERRYREAAAVANSQSIKNTLLKKMNFELAMALRDIDPRRAFRHAKAAQKIKGAENKWPTRFLDEAIDQLIDSLH